MGWPFIGRRRERQAFDAALRSGLSGVVLAGGAGVGKSRLAAELAAKLDGDRYLLVGASASSSRLPMGAFAPHLETLSASHPSQAALLAAAADELDALDLPLLVDDAHHLDSLSATLLHQAVSRRQIQAVVTVRTGEVIPPAVTALWKDGLLSRIDVGTLDEESTRRLIELVLEDEVDEHLADMLWQLSRGNVLYLRHLLEGAMDEGAVHRTDGRWRLVGDLSPPRRLIDLLWDEIVRAGTARVLQAVATMEPFEFDVLVDLMGPDAVAAAERKGMIRVERSDRRLGVVAAHPLFAEIAVRRAPEVELREVWNQTASAIEQTGMHRESDVMRVARLRLDAGAAVRLDVGVPAARAALRLFDGDLADRVLAAGRRDEDTHAARILHARALRFLDRADDALSVLEDDMRAVDAEDEIADAATLAVDTLLFTGNAAAARDLAESVLTNLTDPIARARLGIEAALASTVVGDVGSAVDIGESVLDVPDLPDAMKLGILVTVTFAQALTGRLRDVHERIDTGVTLAELDDAPPLAIHQLTMNRFLARQCEGRMDDATEVGRRHWSQISMSKGPVAAVGMLVADALFEAAAFEEALEVSGKTLEAVDRFDAFFNRPHIHLWAATLALQVGRTELARVWEDQASDEGGDIRWVLRRHRIDAWRATIGGDLPAARDHWDRSVRASLGRGHRLWLLHSLGDALRLGHPRLVVGHLDDLAETMDGETVELFRRHAHAVDDGDGQELDALSGRYGELGWRLRSAEAAADAARTHLSSRKDAASRRAAVRAVLISEGFTELTPPLRTVPEGLSARELDVFRLAAAGDSNQEIADHLYLSVRTIENHLGRIYRKLDLPNRSHLQDVVGPTV